MVVSDSRGGERSASRSRVCRQTQWGIRGDSPRHTFQREYGETGGRWAKKKEGEEATHRTICRVTRRNYTAEKWVRIVPEGLRGEAGVAALCRREGIPSNLHCRPAGIARPSDGASARGRRESSPWWPTPSVRRIVGQSARCGQRSTT
jgi:hypothetical protein